jgi:hypothetical protein
MSVCASSEDFGIEDNKFYDVPLLSRSEIEDAYFTKVEFPEQRIILRGCVRLDEFEYFEQHHQKMLGGLKLLFDPSLEDENIGSIIVEKLKKTSAHSSATSFLTLLRDNLISFLIDMSAVYIQSEDNFTGEDEHGNAKDKEPDAELVIRDETGYGRRRVVLEVGYSESRESLLYSVRDWYFQNSDEVNITIGIDISYVPPNQDLPDQISMTMFVFHREDLIHSQEIRFGQDVDNSQPILARFDSRALFGDDEIPAGAPPVIDVDIRILTPRILQGIHRARADHKKRIKMRRKRGCDEGTDQKSGGGNFRDDDGAPPPLFV